ncbi:MAG: class I SAM-dependent methyltransferase [Deltaproteobacteria bacterium]|nr:class I SAM-dependent methyltransferase [Deltaproteobacteria bacterium]
MTPDSWEDRYRVGDTPWDVGAPDKHLTGFVEARGTGKGRVLEVGCGTGTNALWLAGRGYQVTAVDLSQLAVEKARAKAPSGATCTFARLDFLAEEPPGGPFDLVFDRGCFHVFDEPADRRRFAERVASLLAPGGHWLSLIGSTDGPERDSGPPRRSARDVTDAVEPVLELVELRRVSFQDARAAPHAPLAWFALARRRELPAQPSTRLT